MSFTLYYIHDPMCSWCWGFRPVWDEIQKALPENIAVRYVLGGLASDSDDPMPLAMRDYIQANWRKIQQVIPNTQFNYDFWRQCEPRRSTYPACRAVLAAKHQNDEFERPMIAAIQRAYYLQAKNPSDNATLITLAEDLGLNKTIFEQDIYSDTTHKKLLSDIDLYHQLSQKSGASGFPSLIFEKDETLFAVPRNYLDPQITLNSIEEKTLKL